MRYRFSYHATQEESLTEEMIRRELAIAMMESAEKGMILTKTENEDGTVEYHTEAEIEWR